jgi:Leucine-rich repeat (LRR) protein
MLKKLFGNSKKSELEKLIDADGIDHAAKRFAEIITSKIPTEALAYQFILEEIEAASQGNATAINFAKHSGIGPNEYSGSINNSMPEIDGANGPQQLLLQICSQLMGNTDLMVELKTKITDNIMQQFSLGKYGNNNEILNDNWKDNLIKWAKENNLPEREQIEAIHGSYQYVGFPSDQESITFLSNFYSFERGSIYDYDKSLEINLVNQNISALPIELFQLVGIHVLYLHDNHLEVLPDQIGKLVNLYRLDLGKNNIKSLPSSIGNLVNLEYLNLYGNDISELPDEIFNLYNLNKINIAGNAKLKLSAEQKEWLQSFDEDDIGIDDNLLDR